MWKSIKKDRASEVQRTWLHRLITWGQRAKFEDNELMLYNAPKWLTDCTQGKTN
jgi:nitric oxide reductase activation protein